MAELDQDRLEEIAQRPKSASTDSGSVTSHDLGQVQDVADRKATNEALDGKSAFDCLRTRRISFPGAFR